MCAALSAVSSRFDLYIRFSITSIEISCMLGAYCFHELRVTGVQMPSTPARKCAPTTQ